MFTDFFNDYSEIEDSYFLATIADHGCFSQLQGFEE